MILAIVGMAGSGKSLLAQFFRSVGLPVVRFGEIVVTRVADHGWELTPASEQIVREEIRKEHGMAACAHLSLPMINESLRSSKHVVIDGLYSLAEYKFLDEQFGDDLFVIALFSSKRLRYTRLERRPERALTSSEAKVRDLHEVEKLEKGGPIALANVALINDGTPEELAKRATDLMNVLGIGRKD
jgi:dephospho-CoA kinase